MRALGVSRTSLVPGGVLAGPWVRDPLWRNARAVPTLDLRFADNKSLIDAVTGASLVTFTRTGNGTYVDSAGVIQTALTDVPRFDHNPVTGESLGLLVEEQRTNLKTNSDAILNTNSYSVSNSTLTTATIATPTGSTTASLFTLSVGANTGNNGDGFNFGSAVTLANSTAHAQSLFVKPAGATILRLRNNALGGTHDFTLTGNGTAPSIAGGLTSASITPFPNGWYRVSWTFTTTTSAPGNRSDYWAIKTDVADGTNGLYVVGAQLEAGAFPTSYIPTTTAAVTRSADVVSITGSAFSSWYRQDEGTVFMEANTFSVATIAPIWWRVSDGTSANFIRLIRSGVGATPQMQITSGGAGQGSPFTPGISANTFFKNACYYKTDDFGVTTNGSALTGNAIDTLATMPTGIDRLELSATIINGYYKRLTFWPQRLPNNILQGITQ